jgi:CheY-like chemotaxis protein
VLVVGGEGIASQARRSLPPEAEITHVRTLSEAISAARDASPDVILAEVSSPADGLGLIAALRGDPLTDFLPVVLVASASDGVDAEIARTAGAVELVLVPVEPDKLRGAVERAAQGAAANSIPPQSFGDVTLEELTKALQEEIRRGILGAAGPRAGNARISLGQGSEVLAATWEAIARVRDVVEKRTAGKVRFELPGSPLGFAGAHVLSIGAEEEAAPEDDGALDDPLPERTALVVDDDPGVVWFFSGLLKDAGMSVTECTDGAQALREARRVRPDVIISDILMPGMDGFSLCRAIRRDVALRNTPVILLSWKEDLLVRMRELGANAQGFLRKESKGEAILARVRAVLRPRIRLLRRLEQLAEGAELRGRVERVGVFTLVDSTAKSLTSATLTVTDSFSVTEIEIRDGKLLAVIRTLQDGSLVRGESALLQVLGATNARFAVRRATHAVRANLNGDLRALLDGGAALISAVEDALSGAALLEVASIDLDSEAAIAYARSLPEAMRGIVERIVLGESPRTLVLRDGVAPQELEPILVELARRGAIRTVRGPEGEDLVAPRYTALTKPDEGAPRKDSGTLPAVLQVPTAAVAAVTEAAAASPATTTDGASAVASLFASEKAPSAEPSTESAPASTAMPERDAAATPRPSVDARSEAAGEATAKKSSWKPPQSIDEAAKPGFGIEGQRDSLANAVLAEISDTSDEGLEAEPIESKSSEPASAESRDASDGSPSEGSEEFPEIAEEEGEAELSNDEIEAAAKTSGLPLSGVPLDARGLPRKRVEVDDLPPIEGEAFSPHEPAKRDQSPSSSIIVDVKALGAAVEVGRVPPSKESVSPKKKEPKAPAANKAATVAPAEPKSSMGWLWILVAMLVLGTISYFVVSAVRTSATPDAGVRDERADDSIADATSQAVTAPVGDNASAAILSPGESDASLAASDASSQPAQAGTSATGDAGLVYEDPEPFLDGGTLAGNRGVLVIEGPVDPEGEITVNGRNVGTAPTSVVLSAGVHTIRYRTHAVVVFRFVPVQAGRAVRITLPREP